MFRAIRWYEDGTIRSIEYFRKGIGKYTNADKYIAFSDDALLNCVTWLDRKIGLFQFNKFGYFWYRNKRPAVDYVFSSPTSFREYTYDSSGQIRQYYSYKYGKIMLDDNYDYDEFTHYNVKTYRKVSHPFKGWYLEGISYFKRNEKLTKVYFRKGKPVGGINGSVFEQ